MKKVNQKYMSMIIDGSSENKWISSNFNLTIVVLSSNISRRVKIKVKYYILVIRIA